MIITQRKRSRSEVVEAVNFTPRRGRVFQEKQNIFYAVVTLLAAVHEKISDKYVGRPRIVLETSGKDLLLFVT